MINLVMMVMQGCISCGILVWSWYSFKHSYDPRSAQDRSTSSEKCTPVVMNLVMMVMNLAMMRLMKMTASLMLMMFCDDGELGKQ